MNWHDYLALVLLAGAAAIVLRRGYRFLFGKASSGCASGCGTCPSQPPKSEPSILLTIGDVNPKDMNRR